MHHRLAHHTIYSSHIIVDIVQGKQHFLARTGTGAVYAFGKNDRGQLGLGHSRASIAPVIVDKFATLREQVVQIAAGDHHSIALTALGSVYTWGRAEEGQSGNGNAIQVTHTTVHIWISTRAYCFLFDALIVSAAICGTITIGESSIHCSWLTILWCT